MDFKTDILTKCKDYIEEIESEQMIVAAAKMKVSDEQLQCNYTKTQPRPRQQQYKQSRRFNQQPRSFNQSTPFCRMCHLSKLPRTIFTSHYLGDEACPTMSTKDKNMLKSKSATLAQISTEDDDTDVLTEYGYEQDISDTDDQVKHFNSSQIAIDCLVNVAAL